MIQDIEEEITFDKNKKESKGDNRLQKKLKTYWKGMIYVQLTIGISNKTLNKYIKARYYAWYNTKGHTVYIYRYDIKNRAVDLETKVDMDYQKLKQNGSNTTFSTGFINNGYDSTEELVFY